jgi:hypothetical protein
MLLFLINKAKQSDHSNYFKLIDSIEDNIEQNFKLLENIELKDHFIVQYKNLKLIILELKENIKNNINNVCEESIQILKDNEYTNETLGAKLIKKQWLAACEKQA